MTKKEVWRSSQQAREELYEKISAFEIGDPQATHSFLQRLAQENRWTESYASSVIKEYKRFIYMLATCDHPLTPSDQVDQAWHLHLTYTKSYWDDLCKKVIGRPLHHNPTNGGNDEQNKYNDWYQRTLDTYAKVFDQLPPVNIWPPPETRFGSDLNNKRVNLNRNWILPKPSIFRKPDIPLLATQMLLFVGVVWYLFEIDSGPTGWVIAAVGAIIAVAIAFPKVSGGAVCPRCKRLAFEEIPTSAALKNAGLQGYKCKKCGHYETVEKADGCHG